MAGARHVGGGDRSDVCVLLMLAYLAARICKAEGSRVGFKEGVSRAGGRSAPGRGGHRVNRVEAVGGFTRFCRYVKNQSAQRVNYSEQILGSYAG